MNTGTRGGKARLLGPSESPEFCEAWEAKRAAGETKGMHSSREHYARVFAWGQAEARERWIGGSTISVPTDAMEQEIQAHVRRAVAAERERWASDAKAAIALIEAGQIRPAIRTLVDALFGRICPPPPKDKP